MQPAFPTCGTSNREGTILFAGQHEIYRVPASGGNPVPVAAADASKYAAYSWPRFLPNGRHFIYGASSSTYSDTYIASLDSKENRILLAGHSPTAYAPGFLLYRNGTALMAQPFDSKKGQLVGTARPVIDQVRQGGLLPIFAASLGNVLVYQPARGPATQTQLAWFDRSTDDLRRPRYEVMSPVTHTFVGKVDLSLE
jgi:hypothetical protein